MTGALREQPLMPMPARLTRLDGALPASVALAAEYPGVRTPRLERAVARFLAARPAAPVAGGQCPLVIDCAARAAPVPALGDDESYRLTVETGGVRVSAASEWGILRGLATLTQLWPERGRVPAQRIDDAPRFPWRGLMIDTARRFIPLPDLLRTLDGMALFKVNVLHLHLSDDQGFRFPSRRFPRLASRDHYRRDDLERLVAHAAELGIRVVPELDVPGHATSWLQAYPHWGTGVPGDGRRFGVHEACLDPTRCEVTAAVDALFAELGEVFPDTCLHMGGDEVHPRWWSEDPDIGAYMRRHGLADARALQARFSARLGARLAARGRRPVGWDEVLHQDLPEPLTVQSWRGATARDRALMAGHDCIVSAHYYLDLLFPPDVHYRFDPAAPEHELVAAEDALLEDARLAHVAAGMAWTRQWRDEPAVGQASRPGELLGAEACLWSELVDARVLDVRLWSRMPAVAERFWSPPACRDVADMRRRLDAVLSRLPVWAGIDVERTCRALAADAGVGEGWQPLLDALEPVKWYGRLLGGEALAARLRGREMPQARPYDTRTPLDRVADALPPESRATRALEALLAAELEGDAEARKSLEALATTWCTVPAAGAGPEELELPAARLAEVGRALQEMLAGTATTSELRGVLARAAEPMGEYLLAPVPALLGWVDRRCGAGSGRGC
ncbi:MAG: beta-N-acetylhexosaminidase [Pseudomonadota bacterium]